MEHQPLTMVRDLLPVTKALTNCQQGYRIQTIQSNYFCKVHATLRN